MEFCGPMTFAIATCLFFQDFALDPDENRMRAAAHHMVRSMTAGLALYTCREPLYITITTNLKNAFMQTVRVSIGYCLISCLTA